MAKYNWQTGAGGAAKGAAIGQALIPIPFVGAGIGAGVGSLLGFGGKENVVQPRPDYPYMAAEQLYNWATPYMQQYPYNPAAAYGGQLAAGLAPGEQQTQGLLSQYLGSAPAEPLRQAGQYVGDVLGGKYDPRSSPYYQTMKQQIMKDAAETKAAILHESARAGQLHSDPRREQERKLAEQTSLDLSTLLGGIYESERGRMGEAAKTGTALGEVLQNIPYRQLAMGGAIGGVPREVSQLGLDKLYQEFKRQIEGAREPINVLEGIRGESYDPYWSPELRSYSNPWMERAETGLGLARDILPYFLI